MARKKKVLEQQPVRMVRSEYKAPNGLSGYEHKKYIPKSERSATDTEDKGIYIAPSKPNVPCSPCEQKRLAREAEKNNQ